MSLQAAANHLAAHGRGPDTTLVHMSHGEVKSLQDIAHAHGGSLSINPHTGLPEAGFLSSILPLVAGAALNTFAPGLGAMGAGLLTGAVTGMATGSLSKGLMAGMGAYGGAGLMGGLMGAGEGAMAAQGIQAGMPQFAGDTAAYAQQVDALRSAELAKAAQAPFMDRVSAGFSKVGDAPMDFLKGNLKYAAAAAPSVIQAVSGEGSQPPAVQSDKNMGQRYAYEPGKLQGPYTASPAGMEQQYFNPQYRKVSDTEARGIYGYAEGGQVPAPGEPTKYSYDPLTQMFNKIESIPSDNQTKQAPGQQGGGHTTPMSDAAFAAQQAQGKENAESLANMSTSAVDGLMGLLGQPPMAVQIAQSILGPNGLGIGIGSAPGAFGTGVGYGGTAASGTSGMGFTAGAPSGQSAANSGSGEGGMNAGGGGRGGDGGGGEGGAAGIGAGAGGEGGGFGGGGFGGGWAHGGGISSHLGDYSDGGRLLRGPGDGVSDSIPAQIGNKQPARLADNEFVIPARIVSEIGNGSTEAGARRLYAMMDRVQSARKKTVGKGNIAVDSKAYKELEKL